MSQDIKGPDPSREGPEPVEASGEKEGEEPSKATELLPIIGMGGKHWRPEYVAWGGEAHGKTYELLGYVPAPLGDDKKQSPRDRHDPRVFGVWDVHAIYALYDHHDLIYVGQGVLGNRLWQHHLDDALQGRWDSFTWLSPDQYLSPKEGRARAGFRHRDIAGGVSLGAKELVQLLEFVAIQLADPRENRQVPRREHEVRWLYQFRSARARGTDTERIERVERIVGELKDGVGALQEKVEEALRRLGGSAGTAEGKAQP